MAQHKVVIKKKEKFRSQNIFCLFAFCILSTILIVPSMRTKSVFSKPCGAFVCLIAIHEVNTQIPVVALEVSINMIIFSLHAGIFQFHKEPQNSL